MSVILITGGGRGIGAATARLAARRGYDVAISFRSVEAAAQQVAEDCRAHGVRACAVPGDVAREADVVRVFAAVDRELGRVTALVNNAGIVGPVGRVEDLAAQDLREVLEVNVAGPFLCAREAIRRMARRHGGAGGGIVNVSSISARTGNPNLWIWYAASKAAVDTFTRGLAKEVGPDGIRVNAVAPGLIDTEIHAPVGGRERFPKIAAETPLGRIGQPEEVAEAILWLLSGAAGFITGSILEVSGGR